MAGDHLPFSSPAEQTMGMPAIRRRWTTADVRELMDESRPWPRYELIDGELIVTPSPGRPHQLVASDILFIIKGYVDQQGIGVTFMAPADLELQPGTITQPDIFVVPFPTSPKADEPGWAVVDRLLLAIEIISPSSVRIDRVVKRDFYLNAGVPEYWIVDLDARMIERWTPSSETPDVLRKSLQWLPPGAAAPLTIDLAELFQRIWGTHRKLLGL
jgi:Uma2 family endonuclease